MSILSDFLSCLVLTTLVSFTTPIVTIGTILMTAYGLSYIPGCTVIGQIGADRILGFLAIFGSGLPGHGMITIGLAWAIVGVLFELFSFYMYQRWGGN